MTSVANATPAKERSRVEWLDLFRGAAVLAMIEAHVVNTFLAPALREAAWFGWLNWFNGLIAPSFLFIAGYAQGMGWRSGTERRGAFGRKVKRLLAVAALGYALHFPFTEIAGHRWTEALRIGTQVDVLQCLAVTLLGVLGIQALAGRRRAAGWAVVALCGIATVALAPFSADWLVLPVPVAAFVNDRTGSLFPLFPWAAFVFLGVLAGAFASQSAGWLLVAAGAMKGCALLLSDGTFSALSPAFFCERMAWVLVLAALCRWIARAWTPRGVLFAGRESLVIYAVHLLVIEWTVQAGVPRGLFGLPGVALLIPGVVAAALAVAFAKVKWNARKGPQPA